MISTPHSYLYLSLSRAHRLVRCRTILLLNPLPIRIEWNSLQAAAGAYGAISRCHLVLFMTLGLLIEFDFSPPRIPTMARGKGVFSWEDVLAQRYQSQLGPRNALHVIELY